MYHSIQERNPPKICTGCVGQDAYLWFAYPAYGRLNFESWTSEFGMMEEEGIIIKGKNRGGKVFIRDMT